MKRIILLLSIILIYSSSFLFADVDYLTFGGTGGFSTVNNSASFGFNLSYQYMGRIGSKSYFGMNSHSDFNLQCVEGDEVSIATGVLVGPSFGYAFNPSNFLVFTIAPAVYVESGKKQYVGFGLGLDLNHTLYLGTYKNFGITFGATSYLMFADMTGKGGKRDFVTDNLLYLGFTFRSGDYTGATETYYNIY